MGLRMVISDKLGNFMTARSSVVGGCKDVAVGEVMGFLEALSWVKSLYSWIRRDANSLAHAFARLSRSFDNPYC
ncbi:hypothetical protein ACS0TY_005881 [Phlomoides rotata]